MARARSIKPGFFKNEVLADLPPLTRLLFIGLWTLADREGRIEYRPKKIKAETFPYDSCKIEPMLEDLAAGDFLQIYDTHAGKCILIKNWHKHQSPHVKEPASTIPAPDEHQTSTILAPDKHGAKIPSSLTASSLTPHSMGNFEDDFEELWNLYPPSGRTRKPLSQQQYIEARLTATHEEIMAPLLADGKWTRSKRWAQGYVSALADYLANKRWLESPEQKGEWD